MQEPSSKTIIKHVFEAEPELVWEAWTDPKHLAGWWGPDHFTSPTCEVNVQPGGKLRIDMQGPDGTIYPMTGFFTEVMPTERLSFVSTPLDTAGNALFETLQTVTFKKAGNKTELTIEIWVVTTTAEASQYLAGMEAGWSQSLAKLGRMLAVQKEQ